MIYFGKFDTHIIASNTKQWNVIIPKPATEIILGKFDAPEKSVINTVIKRPIREIAATQRDATDKFQYKLLDVSKNATDVGIHAVDDNKKVKASMSIKFPFIRDFSLNKSVDTLNTEIYRKAKYPAAEKSIDMTTIFLVVPTTPPQRASLCSGNIIKHKT